jgi:uncharacterized alpha-E superfamily protein
MQPRSLEERVTLLEKNLQGLPGRMGAVEVRLGSLEEQFVQFRGEVRAEFSTTREEFHQEIGRVESSLHKKFDEKFDAKIDGLDARIDGLDTKIDGVQTGLKAEMHALHDRALEEMHALHAVARLETDKAIERSMNQARTLHEEAMSQIKLIRRG